MKPDSFRIFILLICSLLPSLKTAAVAMDSESESYSLEDFYGDSTFVTIATGTKKPIDSAPSVASVITETQIKNMGAVDLDDVLESIPGLHVHRTSNSFDPIYIFRGIYTQFNPQVLMLINGNPITNLFVGNRSQVWGGMPTKAISRIEVIRGPGSAVYGADAFAGVINIITKNKADIDGTKVGGKLGSFNTTDFWFEKGTQFGEFDASLIYEFHKTDGHDKLIEADAQTILDEVYGTNASLAPGAMANFRRNHDVRLELNRNDFFMRAGVQLREIGTGAGVAEALNPTTNEFGKRVNVDVSYSNKAHAENHWYEFNASYFSTSQEFDDNLILFPPGADIGFGGPFPDGVIGNPEVFERHYRASTVYNSQEFNNHDLRVGLGYHFGEVYRVTETKNFALGPDGTIISPGSPIVDVSDTPFVFLPERSRENLHIYIQDVWQALQDWEITAGLRYDRYSDFGSTLNPRLAVVWSRSLNSTFKFMYSEAFRAPSFANLFNANNPLALGNPELSPETITMLESSYNYSSTHLQFSANIFSYRWKDVINFVPDLSSSVSRAQNQGIYEGKGFELETRWMPTPDFNVTVNYSYQDSVNSETKERLIIAPKHQLFAEAFFKINSQWNLYSSLNYVMDRSRESVDLREDVNNYKVFDVNLNWQLLEKQQLSFSINNLFNDNAREPTRNNGELVNLPNDLPLAGRTAFVSYEYSF